MSNTETITPAQARRELARRKAPAGSAKRRNYPAKHIFEAGKATLREIAGTPAKSQSKPAAVMGFASSSGSKVPAHVAGAVAIVRNAGFQVSDGRGFILGHFPKVGDSVRHAEGR